jgi:hypothetical protein
MTEETVKVLLLILLLGGLETAIWRPALLKRRHERRPPR